MVSKGGRVARLYRTGTKGTGHSFTIYQRGGGGVGWGRGKKRIGYLNRCYSHKQNTPIRDFITVGEGTKSHSDRVKYGAPRPQKIDLKTLS